MPKALGIDLTRALWRDEFVHGYCDPHQLLHNNIELVDIIPNEETTSRAKYVMQRMDSCDTLAGNESSKGEARLQRGDNSRDGTKGIF